MSDAITLDVSPMTLSGIDGLEERFQARLDEARDAFQDPDLLLGQQKLTAKIMVEVTLECRADTGLVFVTAGTRITLPQRPKITKPVLFRHGRFLMEAPDETQLELIPTEVHPNLRREGGE